jgi:hypothetical protein
VEEAGVALGREELLPITTSEIVCSCVREKDVPTVGTAGATPADNEKPLVATAK